MVVKGLSVTMLVLLGGSFLGGLHGLGDSLAVFRAGLAGLALMLVIAARFDRALALPLAALCLAALVSVGWHKIPWDAPGPVSVYQKNMRYDAGAVDALAADIQATGPDIVTLQEVSLANATLLTRLSNAYPHQHLCRYSDRSGIAVLSRLPPAGGAVCGADGLGFAALRLATEAGPVWAVAVHMSWPFPGTQADQVDHLDRALRGLDGAKLIGGDFNMVPWGAALGRIARASGTRRAGPSQPSFQLGALPLPIDHVFAPGGGRAEARDFLGADHRGILARVHLVPR